MSKSGWSNEETMLLTQMVADGKAMADLEAAFGKYHSEQQIIWKLRRLGLTLAGGGENTVGGMRRCLGFCYGMFYSPDKMNNRVCPNCTKAQGRISEYSVAL